MNTMDQKLAQLSYVQNVLGVRSIINNTSLYTIHGSLENEWLVFISEKYEKENKKLISRILHSLNVDSYSVVEMTPPVPHKLFKNIVLRSKADRFLAFGEDFCSILSEGEGINKKCFFHLFDDKKIPYIVTYSLKKFQAEFYPEDEVRQRKLESFSAFQSLKN